MITSLLLFIIIYDNFCGLYAEFTGSILVAYARAIFRMYKEGKRGAYTIFDVPISYLSSKKAEDLRKELL